MAGETMTLIGSSIASSGNVGSFSITAIPATYTDLLLVVTLRSDNTGFYYTFNGDGGSNYVYSRASWSGTSIGGSYATVTNTFAQVFYGATTSSMTASTFSAVTSYIGNYTGSGSKFISTDTGTQTTAGNAGSGINANRWSGTAAINRIDIGPLSGVFYQYSGVWLYGIKKFS